MENADVERNMQGVAITVLVMFQFLNLLYHHTLSLTHVLHFSVCIKILLNKSILKEILKLIIERGHEYFKK